jgi:hypothetical protein
MVNADEYMKRLRGAVSGILPFLDGETFHQYAERAKGEPFETRWFVSCKIENVLDAMQVERQKAKASWIASARLKFSPGDRQPCKVCGKYRSLTEAHHVVPLAVQFEAGAIDPLQEFIWLCPTHHAAQHVLIAALLRNEPTPQLEGMPIAERDALNFDPEMARYVTLIHALPNSAAVFKNFPDLEAYFRENGK